MTSNYFFKCGYKLASKSGRIVM